MQRERITENIYWFRSDMYAQVTAGVVIGPQWAVVIDTLAMPEESKELYSFVTDELKVPIRYVINTHHHSDHCWGNCFFPKATIIAHTRCSELMREKGIPELEATKAENPAFAESQIVLPHLTFSDGDLTLRVGKKNLTLMLTPGHTEDGISVYIEEDHLLFAGDAFMPIPVLSEGNYQGMMSLFKKINSMGLENIIQGHGDIILRGEIEDAVQENITYLEKLRKAAETARKKRDPVTYLSNVTSESCGKSRVFLNGLAENLHKYNIIWMYKQVIKELGMPSPDELEPEEDEDDFDDLLFDQESTKNDGSSEDEAAYLATEEFDEDSDDEFLDGMDDEDEEEDSDDDEF